MSGHSRWSQIKRKKGKADVQRGKLFSKILREITVAAKHGGGDPKGNLRLKAAVESAKAANMPADNIKRAIMRGTGELPGVTYEEVNYEGYGPGGAAVFLRALTDNRNRTVAEIRHILSKHNGNLGENGCVSWLFEKKGYFVIEKAAIDEEKLLDIVLSAGADDMKEDGDNFEIFTSPESFEKVKSALESARVAIAASEVTMIPQNYVKLEGKDAQTMIKLIETLEDHEDVQNVWSNFDIDAAELKEAS